MKNTTLPSSVAPADLARIVRWYGQSSLRIELGGKLIWLDPVKVTAGEKADLILITHDHADHYSPADIGRLSGPSTIVLAGFDAPGSSRIRPGDKKSFGELTIEAVPAYNVVKTQCHPESAGYCGFILSAGGMRLYDAGDTERIPEMKSMSCDVVFLPLGQTYTMNSVAEAAAAAIDVKAKLAVPFHFGLYEGTEADAREFERLLKGKVEVVRFEKRQ
jgi:L-ascorbate metabolism protein UlaG (beta-lactamase superfamily)